MRNYVQKGDRIVVAAPGATASGAGVLIEDLFGVAENSAAAAGDDLALVLSGIFTLPKDNAAIPLGKKVYWNAGAGQVTATVGANKEIGKAFAAADAAATSVQVRLV